MIDYHDPAWTDKGRFRGGFDDVIIIPLVALALVVNRIVRFILSLLIRLLDFAFPFVVQILWLPLFAARLLGNVVVTLISAALGFLPFPAAIASIDRPDATDVDLLSRMAPPFSSTEKSS